MFGPKMSARSATTLLLVVIAVLLSINLFAQRTTGATTDAERTAEYSSDDLATANALGKVASSLQDIADANTQIAESIDRLAAAVSNLEMGEKEAAPAAQAAPAQPEPQQDFDSGGFGTGSITIE